MSGSGVGALLPGSAVKELAGDPTRELLVERLAEG